MIGFYNYTVILTYLSLLSAGTGIVVSLGNKGHPYWGIFFLLVCGLCDAFDGRVARTKKNRTEAEVNYGIQIDSLSDLVAFGVLPACIGVALIRTSPFLNNLLFETGNVFICIFLKFIVFAVLIFYILAALIRLAYFNVMEEERQRKEGGVLKYYTGLPVTSAALVFPLVMLFRYILPFDISAVYFPVTLLMSLAFLGKFKTPKPTKKGVLIMVGIGALEAVVLVVMRFLY